MSGWGGARRAAAAGVVCAVMAAASGPALSHNADGTHTHWDVTYVVIEVDGAPVPETPTPAELTFGVDGTVSGFAGCNRFTGSYETDGKTLSVGPLAVTRMLCPPAQMDLEALVVAGLSGAARVERDGPRLSLFDEDGELTLTMKRKGSN